MSAKLKDSEKVIRIPFTIYRDNPEHEKVYAILEKQENRNAFLRSAVLAYGKMVGCTITKEDIRQILRESNEELVEVLVRKLTEQSGEEKKTIDFEQLKNLF
jgi:CRISPR/Cas system CSM-associated protein Csm2 small subunit